MNEKREDRQKQKALEAFSAFYDVVKALRGENGCPWDRAQTHSSLKPFLIEEAYETADAVTTMENGGGDADLVEELGDLLFQVMLHSEIGRQEETFTFADVADGIRRKMVHRHPHVFPDAEGRTQKKDWETLKREEKAPETPQEEMERVPHAEGSEKNAEVRRYRFGFPHVCPGSPGTAAESGGGRFRDG